MRKSMQEMVLTSARALLLVLGFVLSPGLMKQIVMLKSQWLLWLILVPMTVWMVGTLSVLMDLMPDLRVAFLNLKRAAGGGEQMVVPAPGGWTRGILDFVFSPKTVSAVFDPLLADQALEWSAAVVKSRCWQARWIRVRYTGLVLLHVTAQAPLSTAKVVIEMWKLI